MSHLKLVTKQKEDTIVSHDKFILLDFEELLHNNRDVIETYCGEEIVRDFKASTPYLSQKEVKGVDLVILKPHNVTEFGGILVYVKARITLEG